MKLVTAVIITTNSPRGPISDFNNDVNSKPKPSRIIAIGIITLIIHFPPFSVLEVKFANMAPIINAKVLAPILMSKSLKNIFVKYASRLIIMAQKIPNFLSIIPPFQIKPLDINPAARKVPAVEPKFPKEVTIITRPTLFLKNIP